MFLIFTWVNLINIFSTGVTTLYTKQFSDFYLRANLKGGANASEYVRYNDSPYIEYR